MLQVQFPRISNLSCFFILIIFILGGRILKIMAKKECKHGKCEVNIPELSVDDDSKKKVDKKDSSKRLR